MALTVKRVAKLVGAGVAGRHTDGAGGVKGLMLCVEGKTSAHWLLRYQRDHKTRHMGLGSARDLTLAAAREKAKRERERLADGIDPLKLRREEREAQRQAEAKRLTFKEAAERCHEALSAGWSNQHHANEFISSLRRWVFPIFGGLDVAAVGKDEVLRVLEQKLPGKMGKSAGGTFWKARSQTADRTRNRIERVLDWALYREEGNLYLFISAKTPGTHIAETTVTAALRNAGRSETVHGMRSCFKTWSEERTSFSPIIAELSLAHAVGNAVERAYRRGDVIVKRRKLLEQWSRFLATPPKADEVVVSLHRRDGAKT